MNSETLTDLIAIISITIGLFFMAVGAVGVIRMPDAYNRLHAVSKCSTLGIMGLAIGAMFHVGSLAVISKAILTIVFALVATPVGSHMLAKATHLNRMKPWEKTLSDELEIDEEKAAQQTNEKESTPLPARDRPFLSRA